jgi:hypothetical protein
VASCISYGLQVMEASSSPARNCSGPSSSSPRMASASEERRMLGFMCRNDYVTDRDAVIISGKSQARLPRWHSSERESKQRFRGVRHAANGAAECSARRPMAWTPSMRLASTTLSVGGPVYGHGDQNRSVGEVHLRNV